MKHPLSARIAWRYLCARKSHSAVGAISVVSICGIAVATAAIICVLSVFNGFKSVIADRTHIIAAVATAMPQIDTTEIAPTALCDFLAQR